MIDFDKALPFSEQKGAKRNAPAKPRLPILSGEGSHPGYFVGLTDPVDEVNEFEKCNVCKGAGTGAPRNGQPGAPGGCYKCGGNGQRIDTKVRLIYEMEDGVTEQEEVNFKLTPPGGKNREGKPISSSTLYDRFYALSGIRTTEPGAYVTPQKLTEWYQDGPAKGERIPMVLNIGDDPSWPGLLKIESVKARRGGAPVNRNNQPNNYDGHPSTSTAPRTAAPAQGNGSNATAPARPVSAARSPQPPGGANGAKPVPANQFGKPAPAKRASQPFTGTSSVAKHPGTDRFKEYIDGRLVHMWEEDWAVTENLYHESGGTEGQLFEGDYEWVNVPGDANARLLQIPSAEAPLWCLGDQEPPI